MLSDKNILITPNIGSAVADPKIEFTGADAGSNVTITATMYADGTLSFDSALGQLFSIASVASGTIFSVADISGMPIIEADSDGSIRMAEFFGYVSIGTGTSVEKLTVAGNVQAVRFVSTQSTGTAPFTVSSTTLVTNLNADLLDGQSGAYYLDWTNVTNKPDPQITVTLTGDVTGTQTSTFTDLANGTISVTATVVDDSHNHIISNVDNLQSTLDAKWPINGSAPVDLNDAGQGLWRIDTGHTNQPSGTNYGTLLSFDNSQDTGFQLAADYVGNQLYYRSGNAAIYGGVGSFSAWRKVWHEGNDGSGSTLDSDLLDGQQGSYYLDWVNITSKPDPTIAVTLTGDVTGTGSVVVTDLATATYTVTFATTIASNSVALGTDTTGNYIATIAGTANQITVSGSGSETAAVTLSTPQDIHTAATPTFSRLTLSQTTGTAPMTVSSTTLVTNLNADLLDGQQGSYYLDWTNVTNKPDPQITVTLTGDVTGTQTSTFTDLANGTISVATTIAANSIVLGTDTTGNYVATIAGTANQISVSGSGSETAAVTLSTPQNIHTAATPTFSNLTLSQTTGTAPLTISSTTAVTNLNADMLDGRHAVGFVMQDAQGSIDVNANNNTAAAAAIFTGSISTWTNRGPFSDNSGALFTLNTHTGNYYSQIWFDTGGNNIYHRKSSAALPTGSWSKIWQESNDGAGSGLDSDLLDGQQGSYYLDWTNITSKPDPTIAVTLTGDVTGTGSVTVTDLATATHTITFATALAAGIIATADIANDAVDNTKLANMAAATVKGRAVGAGTGDPTDLTAAQLVTIIATADGTGSTLDADLLDSYEATAFPRKAEAATISGAWTFSAAVTNNGTDTASQLSGFSVLPRGYQYPGINFRFDQSQTAWLFRQNNLTYTITAGTDPGAAAVRKLFDWTNDYINLQTYKNGSNTWGVEVVGFSLNNSSNTDWRPYVVWHSESQGNVLIEFRAGDNATWSTAYSGVANAYTLSPTATIIAPGVLTGVRFTFSSIASNAYLKMIGAMSTTSDSFAWQMLKSGGDFYGTVNWKDLGTTYASVTAAGVAAFTSLTTTGTIVGSSTVQGTSFISTQTTGTAPLTVSSTTVVANLNADLLDGQQGTYYNNAANLTGTVAFARLDAANDTGGEFPVSDRRALGDVSPDSYRDKAVTFAFTDDYPTLGAWGSAITVKGWSDGYVAWQLMSNAGAGADSAKDHLFFRNGLSGTWNTIRKVWDSGNDGASSGLDADLLDGQHGSYYLAFANFTGTAATAQIADAAVTTVKLADSNVTLAKLANIATSSILGRVTASTGVVEVLTATQVRTLINVENGATADQTPAEILAALLTVDGAGTGLDADLLDAQQGSYYLAFANFTGTVSTAQIANNAVDNTKIRDSAALSVIGNATNASADPADITAGTDGFVLRRAGTTLGFGTLGSSSIAAAAINGTHIDDEAIQSQHFEPDAVGTVAIADNAVTGAKLADYSITGSKISDGTVNSDKIDTSDTYNWFGPHSFKSDLNVDGVLYWNNTSAKLTQAVTVTTDNGSSWWFNLVNSGKTAGLLLYPLVPSVTITANDGAGNYSTIGMSSGGMNFQFVGTADLAVNGTVASLNEVIVGQGNDTPPKLVHLCPPIRYRWTDFESASVQMTSPYIGAAISSGDSATIPPTAFFVAGTQGLLMARSSSTTNSGYRWITEYSDRIVGQADLYFRAVLAINDDMASKTVRFGFHDTSSITDVVDGTYFELAPGSMVCSARSANNSTRSSHGTTFTLTANTFYIFEIYWTSTGSINYKIKSLDEATTHLNVDKTTDIPTGTSRLFGAGLVATSTILATDNLLVIDYMGHGFKNKR